MRKYFLQKEDAKLYFTTCIKPRLDRSYKLYIAYNGDRARQIKKWQSNIFVPYVQAVVETLMPRILDARPDFTVQGRVEDDQLKAPKLQHLADYTWEVAGMDNTVEMVTRSSLVYGTGYLQTSWKKDKRIHEFLTTKDVTKKKFTWEEREQVFYDAPYAEWVDNYSLWYDWHNVSRESKQFWFKRLVLTGAEIRRRYPMADKKRLAMALAKSSGDLQDYGSIRNEVKLSYDDIAKGSERFFTATQDGNNPYQNQEDPDLKMHEVFEWWRPFDDRYAVMTNDVPILKGGEMPNPYNHKEVVFIDIQYLKLPNEFEGYGIPMLLENPQIMLNMIKNQRLDATTLNIHKMWIVNPLANINKEELVTRPFGIIYSPDPNGVKEVQFSDVKSSAYREEELLKADMRYSAGVDDFSMGVGGGADSATEVRHLRESTLERVRLFVNHLGDGFSKVLRHWISMYEQFYTKKMTIRIIGEDGNELYPIVEKDDLMGLFDFKATVIPSIAGMQDVKKKQDMDLFQLLITLPFVDPRKLTSKVLNSWNWNLESITSDQAGQEQQPGMGMPGAEGQMPVGPDGQPLPPEMMAAMQQGMVPQGGGMPTGKNIPPEVAAKMFEMLGGGFGKQPSPFSEARRPINLLQAGGPPPTPKGAPGKGSNPRGHNRGGRVNTNVSTNPQNSNPESSLMNRAFSIQK